MASIHSGNSGNAGGSAARAATCDGLRAPCLICEAGNDPTFSDTALSSINADHNSRSLQFAAIGASARPPDTACPATSSVAGIRTRGRPASSSATGSRDACGAVTRARPPAGGALCTADTLEPSHICKSATSRGRGRCVRAVAISMRRSGGRRGALRVNESRPVNDSAPPGTAVAASPPAMPTIPTRTPSW